MMVTTRACVLIFTLIASASCREMRTVKVTAIEEDGAPIAGVAVVVTFVGSDGGSTMKAVGRTGSSGLFQAQGAPELRIQVGLEKEGYYASRSGRLSRARDHDLVYVMRKVIDPIPLYAKRVALEFPLRNEWIGFDFEVGDWVAPHGGGVTSDALFKCRSQSANEREFGGELEVLFSKNEGVALVNESFLDYSGMTMPHEAPVGGFSRRLARRSESYHDTNYRDNVGYFFRSRVVEADGGIVSANYGKILGNIRFDPRESGWHASHKNRPKTFGSISFTYYFNPTPNDPNLEFDPKRNLFKGLSSTEQVREP